VADQGGLFGLDPDLITNLGIGLLSAGGKNLAGQGNVGDALAGSMQRYYGQKEAKQKLAEGNLDLQTKTLQNQKMMQLLNMVGGLMGDPVSPGQSAGAAPPMGSPPGMGAPPSMAPNAPPQPMGGPAAPPPQGMPPMPQGQPPPQAQAPSWLTPPTPDALSQTPVYGMNPRAALGMAMMKSGDPLTARKELEAQQLEQAQRKYAPVLAQLSTVVKSDSPTREVAANPELSAAWQQLAKLHGFDPKADLNDQNIRTAFTYAHNGLASSVGQPTIAPTVQKQHVAGRLGSMLEVDPITGEEKQIVAPEPLKDVIGKDGKPINVRASAAEGLTPFNQSIYGANAMTDPAMEMAYQTFKATGQMPTGFARNPAMNAKMMDYFAQRSNAEGDSVTSRLARGQQLHATQGVVKDFESGATSKTLNGLNTAVKHMDALDPLIDGLSNGNLTALNKAQNFFKSQTGNPAPTNYAAIKEFVGGEVAKAVLPGGGGEGERRALLAPLDAAKSPEQLHQAVAQIKTALAGKTEALRNQWDVGTQGAHGAFDKFLLPETKKALGIANTPAPAGSDLAAAAAAELARRQKGR
jgi:hypothetical protein